MKKTDQNEQKILKILKTDKKISLNEATDLLQVSESTVRRLFKKMEEKGLVLRMYGGVQILNGNGNDYLYDRLEKVNVDEKIRIAEYSAELVNDGDIIFIDNGTTMAWFSSVLAQRFEKKLLKNVIIFTNSLVNLDTLGKVTEVILVGGQYRPKRRDFSGYIAEEAIKNLHFTSCFLGTDGYSIETGFTAKDFFTARINELVLGNSDKKIILADASKFNAATVISYTKDINIDLVVTDDKIDDKIVESLKKKRIKIIYA